jgi:hypothetical protein
MAVAKRSSRGKKVKSDKRPVRIGSKAGRSEKVQRSAVNMLFSRRFLLVLVGFAAVILLVSGIYFWFNKIYSDPEHVFWSMLDKNLATKSVTKEVTQNSSSVNTSDVNQLVWNSSPMLHGVKTLDYATTNPPTKLVLETISTPSDDYQRYVLIDRQVAGKNKADYISVYNLWLRDGGGAPTGTSQTYSQNVFGAVFFGNFFKAERDPLVQKMKEAYKVDYKNFKKTKVNGRSVYCTLICPASKAARSRKY